MLKHISKIDAFSKNIFLVFAGTSIANLLNLLYQLLIAHRLSPEDFAGFNSLLALYTIIATPLGTFQAAVAKYSAEFNARNQGEKTRFLLSCLLKKCIVFSLYTFILGCLLSFFVVEKLRIPSHAAGYLWASILAMTWIIPVIAGGIQGLELFWWMALAAIITGIFKLLLAFLFLKLGLNISGALAALLLSAVIGLVIGIYALRGRLSLKVTASEIDWKAFTRFLFPVAISLFCFSALVSVDMVMVKYFFSDQESGVYSLSQMLGKIFLFLPGAISLVLFPRASGLNAANLDTRATIKQSLAYAAFLCIVVTLVYNLFPVPVLTILTGKALPQAVLLGRLFSISMFFFTLSYVLLTYFLSINDLRFMKFMIASVVLQSLAILFFHQTLIQVQGVLCINSLLFFLVNLQFIFGARTKTVSI